MSLNAFSRANFDWAVRLDAIWRDHPADIPDLHGTLRQQIQEELLGLSNSQSPLGLLILGPGGSGKTHLLSALRGKALDNDATFVSVDMTDVRDFHETVLLGYVSSLLQPDPHHEYQYQTVLTHVLDELKTPVSGAEFLADVARGSPGDIRVNLDMLFNGLYKRFGPPALSHQDAVRALVLLNSDEFNVKSIGHTWLQGAPIDEEDRKTFRFQQEAQKPAKIIEGLSWLLSLRGPTLLALDQLDAIVAHHHLLVQSQPPDNVDESAAASEAIITDIAGGLSALRDETSRTLTVVASFERTYRSLRQHAPSAFLDRYREPVWLEPLNSQEIAESLVAERLAIAYDEAEFTPQYRTWPFKPEAFAAVAGLLPRELLQRCEAHRLNCIRKGAVTELDNFDRAERPIEPVHKAFDKLDQAFASYCHDVDAAPLLEENQEDAELAGALTDAARFLVAENPTPDHIDVLVDAEFPGGRSFKPLHARIRMVDHSKDGRERHYCIRALQKRHHNAYQARLRAAVTSSGIDRDLPFRHLIIFRSTPLPGGRRTEQMTREFQQRGGLMVPPNAEDLRVVLAIRRLENDNHPEFHDWLRARRHVSNLTMIREARLSRGAGTDNASATEATGSRAPERSDPSSATVANEDRNAKAAGGGVATNEATTTAENAARASQPSASAESGPATNARFPVGLKIVGGQPTDDTVELPLTALRQHALVLAGAGSGKTVLVRRIVEETALLGVPSIVIDAANDLAQLGDRWPEPPQGWRHGDAEKADAYFDRTSTVVWTPGMESGNPVRLEPLPDFAAVNSDPDELEEAVAMARDALQPIVASGASETSRNRLGVLTAALRYFAGHCPGPLPRLIELLSDLPADAGGGISGADKHAAKMADALRAQMEIDPLLRAQGPALDPARLFGIGDTGGKTRVSVVSFTGLQGDAAQQQFINQLAMTLFTWIKRNPARSDQPLRGLLVVDEAKDYVPARSGSACKESLKRLAAQARKYGLGLVFATQAPKDIEHTIVSNCFTHFYGQANSPAAVEAIRQQLQQRGGTGADIARLGKGRFYVYNADEIQSPVKIATPLCLSHHPAGPLNQEEIKSRAAGSRAQQESASR